MQPGDTGGPGGDADRGHCCRKVASPSQKNQRELGGEGGDGAGLERTARPSCGTFPGMMHREKHRDPWDGMSWRSRALSAATAGHLRTKEGS